MKSFPDYLGLSNSCSYDVDVVIGRADRFGFQNFCSPAQGTKFWCKQKHLVTAVICYKFQKISEVWFYTIFFMILYMYKAPEQGLKPPRGQIFYVNRNVLSPQPLADKIFTSTGTSCHFGHLLQVQKYLFEVWFYTIYFMVLYMYIAPGQEQTAPRGQSFDVNRNDLSRLSFVASFKKMSNFIKFFHDLIHVYSPGAGADIPSVKKNLITICCKFQRKSLKSDFIQIFSWFNTCI